MTITERLASSLADRYRIERTLGRGGMATVYLAHDIKHERLVALKVLKPELAAVLGAERFVVEIKTTAQLSHPHILPLFDSGSADGFLYYVMPYVEGETLRDRLNRETQLGVDEALRIATEVADALEYAHSRGVIHRDIKPENILLQGGRPMVADFGIALAVSAAAGGRMTETGLSLGTPHYMSPEQATADKEITGRSDQYSLASVLYEMLTGEPPHMGTSAQQIIMKIIAEDPKPVTALRRSVPGHVASAVAKALQKLPADRFTSAHKFSEALAGRGATGTAVGTAPAETRREGVWRARALVSAVVAVLAVLAAVTAWSAHGGRSWDAEPVEFAYRSGNGARDDYSITISRNGRHVLQALRDSSGTTRVVRRDLGAQGVTEVPGSRGARDIAVSPDGRWILFFADGKVRRIAASGGPPMDLADSANGGAWWGRDRQVYYSKSGLGLARVPEDGGASESVTALDSTRNEFNHWYPELLPGERAVSYTSFTTPLTETRIEAVDLKSRARTVVVENAMYARYIPGGYLAFFRDGVIFVAPFDTKTLRLTGPPVPVVEDVAGIATDGLASYDIADNGTLVYLKASEWSAPRRVMWSDRRGRLSPIVSEVGAWAEPRLSPDGRWLSVTRVGLAYSLWLLDRTRGVLTELSKVGEGGAFNAHWTPDSRALVHTFESPIYDIARTPIDGGTSAPVIETRHDKLSTSLSADGRTLFFVETRDRDRIFSAPMAGGTPTLLDDRPTSQRGATLSPNGAWLAYEELAPDLRSQVFVRALGGGNRLQVSADGGDQPRWTKGGRELVYRRGGDMHAVPFDPATGEPGRATFLFRHADAGRLAGHRTRGYDVTPDGERFALVIPEEQPDALPVVVVLNWSQSLARRFSR